MESRGTWGDLIAGVGLQISEVFDQGQEEYLPGLGNLLQTRSAVGAQENFRGKTGVGELQKFDDGDNLPSGRRYPSYLTSVNWVNYGRSIDVTKNAITDRDFAAELEEMKDLSIGANYSQDRSAMQIFNGGFATTVAVNGYDMTWYGDAVALFSTAHTSQVPGQANQSNRSATDILFSHDNLETGTVAMLEQQTDDGIPLALLGKQMVVLPPALRKEGLEITESELDPSTANNAINVYRNGMQTDMASSLHLATSNGGLDAAWFLLVPGRAKLVHFTRQAPTLEKDVNIKNKVVTFTVDARWADAVLDWRRTWGSNGDGS